MHVRGKTGLKMLFQVARQEEEMFNPSNGKQNYHSCYLAFPVIAEEALNYLFSVVAAKKGWSSQ